MGREEEGVERLKSPNSHFLALPLLLSSLRLYFCVQALKHLLQCPSQDSTDSIELAIETVAQARDSELTNHLIKYLLGDIDGIVKVFTLI